MLSFNSACWLSAQLFWAHGCYHCINSFRQTCLPRCSECSLAQGFVPKSIVVASLLTTVDVKTNFGSDVGSGIMGSFQEYRLKKVTIGGPAVNTFPWGKHTHVHSCNSL